MKSAQDPDLYADKLDCLVELQELERQEYIELFYGDESGFCVNSVVPYGWQFKNEQVNLRAIRSKRLNVLGLMNRANELHFFEKEGTIDSAFVVEVIDRFIKQKGSGLIMLNAEEELVDE